MKTAKMALFWNVTSRGLVGIFADIGKEHAAFISRV